LRFISQREDLCAQVGRPARAFSLLLRTVELSEVLLFVPWCPGLRALKQGRTKYSGYTPSPW
jgi:hypothetical protein